MSRGDRAMYPALCILPRKIFNFPSRVYGHFDRVDRFEREMETEGEKEGGKDGARAVITRR